MNRRIYLSFVIFLFLFSWATTLFAKEVPTGTSKIVPQKIPLKKAKQVGIVVSLKGKALITRNDGKRFLARLKSPILIGDRIDTGVGSYMQIDFIDRSKVSLLGSSDFSINSYIFDINGKARFEMEVDNGFLRFMSGGIGKIAPEEYKIKTVSGSIGIRGSSGELVTADGSLPGRPKQLEVMKKGGKGITFQPPQTDLAAGLPTPPPMIMELSGQGFAVDEVGNVEQVVFVASPAEKYIVEEKKRVEKAKAKKKQQEKEEKEVAQEQETAETETENETEPDSQEPAPIATEGEEAPEGETLALTEYDESIDEAPPPIAPIAELELETEEFSFEGFYEFEGSDLVPPIGELDPLGVDEALTQIAAVTEVVETATEEVSLKNIEEAQEEAVDAGFDFKGFQVGLSTTSTGTTSTFSHKIFGTIDEKMENLLLSFEDNNDLVTMELPTLSGSSYSSALVDSITDSSNIEHLRFYDNLGEFYIINSFEAGSTESSEVVSFFGKESTTIPSSGQYFYTSELHQLEVSSNLSTTSTTDPIGAFLSKDGAFLNPGIETNAMVDFTNMKAAGIVFSDITFSGFDSDSHSSSGSSSQTIMMTGDLPSFFYGGTLASDGSISGVNFYSLLGYTNDPTSTTVATADTENAETSDSSQLLFNTTLLNSFAGEGQVYGSESQGVGFQATDGGTGAFVAGGLQEISPDFISESNSDGSYSGRHSGVKVDVATGDLVAYEGDIILSASFTNNEASGTFSLIELLSNTASANVLQLGNSFSLALNRQGTFATLSSDNSSFPVLENSSFILTHDLPQISTDSSSDGFATPDDLMWGFWNIVEDSSADNAYPGLHNYWVAGIPQQADESEDIHLFRGGSLKTYIDTTDTTNSPPLTSDSGINAFRFDLSTDSFSGLSFHSDGSVLLFHGEAGDVTNPSFEGEAIALSPFGLNTSSTGYFSDTFDGLGAITGSFTGSTNRSLYFNFDRHHQDASTGDLQLGYGVGVALETGTGSTSESYAGSMMGLYYNNNTFQGFLDESDGTPTQMSLSIASSNGVLSGTMTLDLANYPSLEIDSQSDDVNTFITKDAFLSSFSHSVSSTQISLGHSFTMQTLDPINTFALGIPGLEDFQYVSWGIWGTQGASTTDRALGFFGIGLTSGGLPDVNHLANSAYSSVDYTGKAFGYIVNNATSAGSFELGTATMNVDFQNGNLSGTIDLNSAVQIQLNNGTLDVNNGDLLPTFSGDTALNGITRTGGFAGEFFGSNAEEGIGSYSAGDGTTSVIGAFGVKSN